MIELIETPAYNFNMQTVEVTKEGNHQIVHLPDGWNVLDQTIGIRRDGEKIVLEPLKPLVWPPNFFKEIYIADESFRRPEQGSLPPVKEL
jgi:hypothetical protein